MEQMSCTGRFVRPFVRLLTKYPVVSSHSLDQIRAQAQDRRVNLRDAYDTLSHWVKQTGDADLGLKAGQLVCLGSGGVLEYAMHSAASVREGTEIAGRYARLFSDALEPKLIVEGNRAIIRLDNKLPWPRVAADFTLAAWYTCHIRVQLAQLPEVECWFAHEPPPDLAEYERAFAPAKLRFGAPFYGFMFDVDASEAPLASADASLHAVHCEHLVLLHASLLAPRDLTARVRQILATDLRRGNPNARSVARELHMSRRTLARRLDAEGTTFTAQLDELRRQLALHYVSRPDLPLTEVTNLLGFSHVQGFHRAFKRWTGQTPIQYRESQQSQLAARH
jgi:AraC-like DNA-binding protein